jgi:hypothetical protein
MPVNGSIHHSRSSINCLLREETEQEEEEEFQKRSWKIKRSAVISGIVPISFSLIIHLG